jgi:uncharacterized membrane protein HdeD (DUF308 family)
MFIKILGFICIILGILAIFTPGLAGLSTLIALGVIVLIGGIARIIWAFHAESIVKGLLRLALSALTIICGILLINHPIFASGVLTIILALYFILDGISEIASGMVYGVKASRFWLLFGGIVSILLGVVIWMQFPFSGVWALGILVGIKLFLVGLTMVMLGSAVRTLEKAVDSNPA